MSGAATDNVQLRKQMMSDWLMHAVGCRRRAHEYKRLARQYETTGNLSQYRDCRAQSDQSWRLARDALRNAHLQRRLLNQTRGISSWH